MFENMNNHKMENFRIGVFCMIMCSINAFHFYTGVPPCAHRASDITDGLTSKQEGTNTVRVL